MTARADPHVVEIFRSGTHRSMSGTEIRVSDADLAATAAAYNRPGLGRRAPLVIGHPPDDVPALGFASKLYAVGGRLFAEVREVAEDLKTAVRDGRYKKISASFFLPKSPGNPSPGLYHLKHVGFLGATPPAVRGMADPVFAEFSGGVVCFSNDTHAMPATLHSEVVSLSQPPEGFTWRADHLPLHGEITALHRAAGIAYGDAAEIVTKTPLHRPI